MVIYKTLTIDAKSKEFKVEAVDKEEILGPVDLFFEKSYSQEEKPLCFGGGVLSGSILPSSERLIFAGHSPLWESFYISTVGGSTIPLNRVGVNGVIVWGKAEKVSVLIIKKLQGRLDVRFEPIENLNFIFKDYNGMKGTHAIRDFIWDKYGSEFENVKDNPKSDGVRILVAGPSAVNTKLGGVMSTVIRKRKMTFVDCWAGRGGFGSKMLQEHNIAGVIYGGDEPDQEHLRDFKKLNEIFKKEFEMSMSVVALKSGEKYYYKEALKTGGTLGANFASLKDWNLTCNWSSIYNSTEENSEIDTRLVQNHYLKQFNEETIQPKLFDTCGETCVIQCKKMKGKFEKDYEPYEANGPNTGIFDQRAAEELNYEIDSLGVDSIEIGTMVGWIMEMLDKDLINPKEYGLSSKPKFDLKNFDVVKDSEHNAKLSSEIINMIFFSDKGEVFRKGIRQAAKELGSVKGKKVIDLALFVPHGKKGYVSPNQYWVPGFFLPVPIQGKYLLYYAAEFKTPQEYGKHSADRMAKELISDNLGVCRFHRGWLEKIGSEIINSIFSTKINLFVHHTKLVQKINSKFEDPLFWESEKVVDVVKTFYEKLYEKDKDNLELKKWVDKFNQDKWATGKEFWDEVLKGFNACLDIACDFGKQDESKVMT